MTEYAQPNKRDNRIAFNRNGPQPITYRFAERLSPWPHRAEYFHVSDFSIYRPIRVRVADELSINYHNADVRRVRQIPLTETRATLRAARDHLDQGWWLEAAKLGEEVIATAGPASRHIAWLFFNDLQRNILSFDDFAPAPEIRMENIDGTGLVPVPFAYRAEVFSAVPQSA